jgi:hypothetical protein
MQVHALLGWAPVGKADASGYPRHLPEKMHAVRQDKEREMRDVLQFA